MDEAVEIRETKKGLTFDILVVPNASRAEISGKQDRALKVRVTAPPVEGAANEACIKLLAGELGLKKSRMEIFAGGTSRKKTVLIRDTDKKDLALKVQGLLKKKAI